MEFISNYELFPGGSLPLKVLRLAPVIMTTTLFINRVAQYYALSTFLPPHMSSAVKPGQVLQHWLRGVVSRIWPGIVTLVMLLRIVLAMNLVIRPHDFKGTNGRLFYGVTMFFAFAHLAVAPKMVKLENRLQDLSTKAEETQQLLVVWLGINNIRLWVVDVPLWIFSIVAALSAIKI